MDAPAPTASAPARIAAGTPAFRRINIAIFFCGFSIFAILYCTQPVLPLFTEEFGVSAAESSLALSLTTATMAVAMLFASSLSEVVGRKPMMLAALVSSSILTLLLAFAQEWSHVLWLRALAGVALSGMPAVALAYLGEEMEPKAVASAVGIYIGGGAFGGMSGRLVVAALADYGSWRLAVAALAFMGLASAFIFWRALPPSRHFHARAPSFGKLAHSMLVCARNPGIALLLVMGFLLLGGFMTVFNYLGFRLQAEPFLLTQALAGLIYVVYPAGSVASAFMGGQAARHGRGRVLVASLCLMTLGLVLMTPDSLADAGDRPRRPHLRLLRRAFHRQRLGACAGRQGQGAGLLALFIVLLHRRRRCGHGGRPVLGEPRLDWRRAVLGRHDGGHDRHRAAVVAHRAALV